MDCTKRKDFFTIPRLEKIPFLVHGFGTKNWRVSNLKRKPEWRNFKHLFLKQIHSDVIQCIDEIPDKNLKGDAIITSLRSVLLIIKTADCLPILIVDESQNIIAAAHAGWKGTQKRVVQKLIKVMNSHYGCQTSSLLLATGPCVELACYEVGKDVKESFMEGGHSQEFFRKHPLQEGKYFFDLRGANLSQMIELGVKRENVFSVDVCTFCHENLASYRREKKGAGRMLSFIGLSL